MPLRPEIARREPAILRPPTPTVIVKPKTVTQVPSPKVKATQAAAFEPPAASAEPAITEPAVTVGFQRLIQPVNDMKVGLGYKNEFYRERMKQLYGSPFVHYGSDYWGELTIFGSGNGEVVAVGNDSTFGNTAVILYPDCYNHVTGEVRDMVARYYHMATIRCRAGQKITKDSVIGIMGTTGKYSNGVHVHFELDTDAADPLGVPGIYPTNLLHPSDDTTADPAQFLYTKASLPDRQKLASAGAWYRQGAKPADYAFPVIK